ncbi:MAG: DUF2961 domain-containing protein [Planctomycetota bacterium]
MHRHTLAILSSVLLFSPILLSQAVNSNAEGEKNLETCFTSLVSPLIDNLPLLPGLHAVHQFSSHNKKGENGDAQWHLYDDEHGDAVIFDVRGPGCIRSMWGTDLREGAVFKFYFDEEEKPRFTIPMLDFYQGKHPLFPPPLVSYERRGHWGDRPFAGNSFVPIPFSKGLKISVSGHLEFYHILFLRYPHGTQVDTFTGDEDRSFLLEAFDKETNIGCSKGAMKRYATAIDEWPPGQELSLLDLEQAGCIREITIEGKASDTFMQEAVLRMTWDEIYPCSVQAPLGFFFGSAVHPTEMHTLPSRIELLDGERVRLTTWFPMPFWQKARIQLINRSAEDMGAVRAEITVDSQKFPHDRAGYFTTCFHKGWTPYGRDWLFFESPGTGWFVGAVQSMHGEHYCEGDEHIYMDGAISPQINGTGSEDYFLACFWPNLNFNSPFANCVGDIQEEGGGTMQGAYHVPSCYSRFHLEAPIPFFNHIDARIQHGGLNAISSQYGSIAYAYVRNQPSLILNDVIDVGNAANEAAHRYETSDKSPIHLLEAHPEGNHFQTTIKDHGRRHAEGTISFNVAIDPGNQGVRLRRRLDQAVSRQKAVVFIYGKPVGTWYDPDQNEYLRWYESDFDIHQSFTQGREKLEVKLEICTGDGCGVFTDYRYEAFSFVP